MDERIAKLLDDYVARQQRGEKPTAEDYRLPAGETWPEFARLNPELFDSRLLRQYYEPATLASPLARTTFVLEKLRAPVPVA